LSLDALLPNPVSVRPEDLVGTYAFYDDGWPQRLTIANASLEAWLHSYRFNDDYAVTVDLGKGASHKVTIYVHDFNELPEQVFTGWFMTRSRNAIAGFTDWKGKPFGFFARRGRVFELNPPTRGPIVVGDFAGGYSLYSDGVPATLRLEVTGSTDLAGTVSDAESGSEAAVVARVDSAVPNRLTFVMPGLGDDQTPPTFTGYLFGESRRAIAGEMTWNEVSVGCYLTRFR
jgi:hypothetical protein